MKYGILASIGGSKNISKGGCHGTFGRKHDVCWGNTLARIGHIYTGG